MGSDSRVDGAFQEVPGDGSDDNGRAESAPIGNELPVCGNSSTSNTSNSEFMRLDDDRDESAQTGGETPVSDNPSNVHNSPPIEGLWIQRIRTEAGDLVNQYLVNRLVDEHSPQGEGHNPGGKGHNPRGGGHNPGGGESLNQGKNMPQSNTGGRIGSNGSYRETAGESSCISNGNGNLRFFLHAIVGITLTTLIEDVLKYIFLVGIIAVTIFILSVHISNLSNVPAGNNTPTVINNICNRYRDTVVVKQSSARSAGLNSTIVMLGPDGKEVLESVSMTVRALGCEMLSSESNGSGAYFCNGVRVISVPSYTDNPDQDEESLALIIRTLKAEKTPAGSFIWVLNEQDLERVLDWRVKAYIRILVDSFGPEMLNHMGVLFTRSNRRTVEESVQYVNQHIAPALRAMTGYPISFLPSWQVENYPERLANGLLKVSQETINKFHARNIESVKQLTEWASIKPALNVSNSQPGKYPSTRECRDVEVNRTLVESGRYGFRCTLGIFGGRQYQDQWQIVIYQTECRSIVTIGWENSEHRIFSNWNGTGGLTTKMEDRKPISMSDPFAWQEWFKSDAIPISPSSL